MKFLPLLLFLESLTIVSSQFWNRFTSQVKIDGRSGGLVYSNRSTVVFTGGLDDSSTTSPSDLFFNVDPFSPSQTTTTASLRVVEGALAEIPDIAWPIVKSIYGDAISVLGMNPDGTYIPSSQIRIFKNGVWNTTSFTGTGPSPRRGATATFLRECRLARNCLVVYGGVGPTTINTNQDSCWLLLLNSPIPAWQICTQGTSPWPSDGGSGTALAARGGLYGHAAAASPDGLSVFIYGGTLVSNGRVSEDIYQFKVDGFADGLTVDADLFRMTSNAASPTIPNQTNTPLFSNDPAATLTTLRRAIDGSTANPSATVCFISSVMTDPYYRIDLGYQPPYANQYGDNQIYQIRVWMNTANPLANVGLQIWISNVTSPLPWQPGSNGVLWPNPFTDPIYYPTVLWTKGYPKAPVAVNGRYVFLTIPGTGKSLQLCEVGVYQPNYWRWRKLSGQLNVAFKKQAKQSSMDPNPAFLYADPLNGVDGITGTNFRSLGGADDPWWVVDLGETYDIDYVQVLDGGGSNWWRSFNLEVWMGDNADPFSPENRQCAKPHNPSCYCMTPLNTNCCENALNLPLQTVPNTPTTATCTPRLDLINPQCVNPASPINYPNCKGEARYVFLRKQTSGRPALIDINVQPAFPIRSRCKFFGPGNCPAACVTAFLASNLNPVGNPGTAWCDNSAGIGDLKMLLINEVRVFGNAQRFNPTGRTGAAFTAYGSYLVVAGGIDNFGYTLSDVRLFNMATLKWEKATKFLGTPPLARSYASLALVPAGSQGGLAGFTDGSISPQNKLLYYGGMGVTSTFNDLSILTFPSCPALNPGGSAVGVTSVTCYRQGTVCTYSCAVGFVSNNNQAFVIPTNPNYYQIVGWITCNQFGNWDAYFPLCVADTNPSVTGYLPSPPTFVTDPTISSQNTFSAAFSVALQRPIGTTVNAPNGPTVYRVESVPQYWIQRFAGQPLDSAWSLRAGPPGSTVTGTYSIDPDGYLGIDGAPNADCKFAQQDCTLLVRSIPQGGNLPNFATEPWSIDTKVSFQFFNSKAPQTDHMIGFGLLDESVSMLVPNPANASQTVSMSGAIHFLVDIKRTGGVEGGWESTNQATGFKFIYRASPNVLTGITGSPEAWLRLDHWPDETVIVGGTYRAGFGAWRVCTRYNGTAPWSCGTWENDNAMLRAGADTIRRFNPATTKMFLFSRSRTALRSYGRVHWIRYGPLNCAAPGPKFEIASTTTSGGITAQQTVITPESFGVGQKYKLQLQSGTSIGWGPVSAASNTIVVPYSSTVAWNSANLIEVARNKRTGYNYGCDTPLVRQNAAYTTTCLNSPNSTYLFYGPERGVDGIIDVVPPDRIDTGFVMAGRKLDGAFWFVDLGIPTAVKEIAIYNTRVLAQQYGLDNFIVSVTQSQDRNSGPICDPAQVPSAVRESNVFNGFAAAARFNCSYPTGVVGRYVYISAGLQMNNVGLFLRELQVFASNQCPTARSASGATQIAGTNCAAGAPWGAVCVHECIAGYIQVAGSTASTCNGDTWNDPPLRCVPFCPLISAPENSDTCEQVYLVEPFTNAGAVSTSWISLMEAFPSLGPNVFAVNSALQISTGPECTQGVVAVSTNQKVNSWVGGFTASVKVKTTDRAGLAWRAQDINNFLRLNLDVVSGVHYVERVYNGKVTLISTSTSVIVPSDTQVTLSIVVQPDGQTDAYVNDRFLLSVTDLALPPGLVGVSATGFAEFDDFKFTVDCNSECQSAAPGETCKFTCAPGLRALGLNDTFTALANPYSGTRTCVAVNAVTSRWVPNLYQYDNVNGVDMACSLDPPVFPAVTLFINENSARNTNVDAPLVATIASPDYQVVFAITAGNLNNTFYVDSCSGQVKVRNPLLNFEVRNVYSLSVTASVSGFPSAATTTIITVRVVDVDEAPALAPLSFTMPENPMANTLVRTLKALDPENDQVEYTIESDGSAGRFLLSIDGRLFVNPNMYTDQFNFEDVGSWPYVLLVRATEVTALNVSVSVASGLRLFTSAKITISLSDVNDPPTIQAGQVFTIPDTDMNTASVTTTNQFIVSSDQDATTFSSSLTYSIVSPSIAQNQAACNTFSTNPQYRYYSDNGLSSGNSLGSIGSSSGEIFKSVLPNPPLDESNYPTFKISGGSSTRINYVVCVNISDTFGGFSINSVILRVGSTSAGIPDFTSLTTTSPITTRGQKISFTGTSLLASYEYRGFGIGTKIDSNGNVVPRRIDITSCSPPTGVTSGTQLDCNVAPGSGKSYKIDIQYSASGSNVWKVATSGQFDFSYADPTITSVTPNVTLSMSTSTTLTVLGDNFSNCTNDDNNVFLTIIADKSPPFVFKPISSTCSHSSIQFFLSDPLHSENNDVTLSVGSVKSSSSSVSYEKPVISSVSPNINLGTDGGDILTIGGLAFGKNSIAPITGTIGSFALTSCSQLSPSSVTCTTPGGVGKDLPVSLKVGNQATNVDRKASYKAPVITSVSTKAPMSTAGGEEITILGNNFGPTGTTPIMTYEWNGKTYISPSCASVSSTKIVCISMPGIGSNMKVKLDVGGQTVEVASTLSYAPPTIFSFSGVGAVNAQTSGSEDVIITGTNFGPFDSHTNANIAASYGAKLQFGPSNITTILWTAVNCQVTVGHTEATCKTSPGAGRALSWSLVIGGQTSVVPTTSYAPPSISGITLQVNRTNTVSISEASVSGGTVAIIVGSDFGISNYLNRGPLVQSVTYGVNGNEYKVPAGTWSVKSHTLMHIPLVAGSGKNLKFMIQVADQMSLDSTATFSYATPFIAQNLPTTAGTYSDPLSPTTMTLNVLNLPVLDSLSQISVLFKSVVVTPTVPSGLNAIKLATNADSSISMSFPLPRDFSGKNIPILVSVFNTVSGVEVDRSSPIFFSYEDPAITEVVVTKARFSTNGTSADTPACMLPNDASWDCSDVNLMKISINGKNFGTCNPSSGVCPDGNAVVDKVSKSVEFFLESNVLGSVWCSTTCTLYHFNTSIPNVPVTSLDKTKMIWTYSWTHREIVVYAKVVAATLRIRLVSDDGSDQVVNRTFLQASPEIFAITGARSDIPTIGSSGVLNLKVFNLQLGNNIIVYVGKNVAPMVYTSCSPWVLPGTYSDPTSFINAQINARTAASQSTEPLSICITIPPGQGSNVPVQIVRTDSMNNKDYSNTGETVSYSPPTVTSIEVIDSQSSVTECNPKLGSSFLSSPNRCSWNPIPSGFGRNVVEAKTDGSSLIRFIGTNLGFAPIAYMGDSATQGFTNITACPGTVGQHTCYEAYVPTGEGTGSQWPEYNGVGGKPLGYRVWLSAGNQDSANMGFKYRAPSAVTFASYISGTGAPTSGGVVMKLSGINLGSQVGGRPDSQLSIQINGIDCAGADVGNGLYSRSSTEMFCYLPVSSGKSLSVVVKVADQSSCGPNDWEVKCIDLPKIFSYDPPILSTITFVPIALQSVAFGTNNTNQIRALLSSSSFSPANAQNVPGVVTGSPASIPLLEGQTGNPNGFGGGGGGGANSARDIVILEGNNFGARDFLSHCAFMTWTFRADDVSRVHKCDELENFLGEGEISKSNIIYWDHTRIIFSVPDGLGTKDIEISVRGNMLSELVPRNDIKTPRFRYLAPNITYIRIGNTGCTPQGGNRVVCTPALADTEGGESTWVTGTNFGPSPRNTTNGNLQLNSETGWALNISEAAGIPTAIVAITFHRTCGIYASTIDGRPISKDILFKPSYPNADGSSFVSVSNCDPLNPGMVPIKVNSINHGFINFQSAGGIGVNRLIQVHVIEDASRYPAALTSAKLAASFPLGYANPPGGSQISSNLVSFSYKAPSISSFDPSTVYLAPSIDEETGKIDDVQIRVIGSFFGNEELAVQQGWTSQEKIVTVKFGSVECIKTSRVRENGQSKAVCNLQPELMPAGMRNTTITIAGQIGFADANTTSTPIVFACKSGFFGKVGETCLPCPAQYPDMPQYTGALCEGYMINRPSFEQRFTYPRPLKGWYNLNSSDRNSLKWGEPGESMMSTCPEGFQVGNRDVCIAPCDPPEACLRDNICAFGYASKAPAWRCSNCDTGFYRRNIECIKCPDSPWALVIGMLLLIIFAGGLGYFLAQKGVNIAVVSIGIDFFQVLAIFAASGVKWPPIVKEFLHILSAFNLNIEIVAPECVIPDLSYKAKFYFIMLLPLSVGSLLLFIFVSMFLYKMIVLGQDKKTWFSHRPALIGTTLGLLYILYLYLTRTIFDVFNCTPSMPPDGYLHLSVANNERCGVPGGTQLTLMPAAVAGLVVYSFGYPLFISYVLFTNKENVMLDQVLRAKGTGDDRLSNPLAFELRQAYGRQYFQFKPDYFFWILVIILRKFFISITAVVFSKNSAFQMAACLMVMFLAYTAQMMFMPYMSAASFDQVLKSHTEAAFTNAFHARIKNQVSGIEARGRKKAAKNLMTFDGKIDRSAVLSVLTGWLFDYNTIEQLMIFAAVIVCLMGIMYQANSASSFYPGANDGVTAVVMIDIIAAIVYYLTVLITEMVVLYNEDSRRIQMMRDMRNKKRSGEEIKKEKSKKGVLGNGRLVDLDGQINTGQMDAQVNPLFLGPSAATEAAGKFSHSSDMLMSQRDPPTADLWAVFKVEFSDLAKAYASAQQELAEARNKASFESMGNDTRIAKRKSEFAPHRI
jgi:hypothetical protein